MTTITLDVPDHVAVDLQRVQNRLPEILELGMKRLSPSEVYRYIFDFLASEPSDEAIATFRPMPAMESRLRQLIQQEREDKLSKAELQELDEYERIEHFIVMLKSGYWKRLVQA